MDTDTYTHVCFPGQHPFLGEHAVNSCASGPLAALRQDEIEDAIADISYSMDVSDESWSHVSDAAIDLVHFILVEEDQVQTRCCCCCCCCCVVCFAVFAF